MDPKPLITDYGTGTDASIYDEEQQHSSYMSEYLRQQLKIGIRSADINKKNDICNDHIDENKDDETTKCDWEHVLSEIK